MYRQINIGIKRERERQCGIVKGRYSDRVRQRGIELVRLIEGDTNMDTLRYGGGLIQRGRDREVYGER